MVFQLYLMGIMYSVLGVLHFTNTQFYRTLMPKFLPAHDFLIYLSGIAEIVLGIGIFFIPSRSYALWGIIVLLAIFLTVHVNMLFPENQLGIQPWKLWLRIPIQFILMYWAYVNLPQT